MHIAFCCAGWPPDGTANGVVSYVQAMRDACSADGHHVSVIANGTLFAADGSEHVLDGVPDTRGRLDRMLLRAERWFDGRRGHLPGVARAIAAQVRQAHRIAPIDIVEMEESFGWPMRVERLAGVPVAVRLHGPYFMKPDLAVRGPEGRRNRQRVRAEGRAILAAHAISAPNELVLKVTQGLYGFPEERAVVIPNPIPPVPEHLQWRADRHDPDMLLYVGRFDAWKGADTAIAAFAALAPQRPRLRLVMVGPDVGIADDDGTLRDFHAYVARHVAPEIRPRIDFTGRLPPGEVAGLRQRAALCLFASRVENFPYALFEALAAGCPVVSTQWLGVAELIAEGQTGLLTPVGDPAKLADKIAWLLDHPEQAARIGAAARADCAARFSPRRISRELTAFYHRSIAQGAA